MRDWTGTVLPGVIVEATSPALIEKARTALTDINGEYTFLDLPPGRYRVTFSLPEFATDPREGVEVTIGLATVNADMRLAERPTIAPLDDLLQRVRTVTAPEPLDCGRFSRFSVPVESIDVAIQCGVAAAEHRTPFWFHVGGYGVDSWVASGLLAGKDGQLQQFFYDSDPSGGGGVGFNPRFTLRRCDNPAAAQSDGKQLAWLCYGKGFP